MAVTTEQLMELKKKVGAIRDKSLQDQATMVEGEKNIKRLKFRGILDLAPNPSFLKGVDLKWQNKLNLEKMQENLY